MFILYFNAVVFGLLFSIWQRSNFLNFMIKVIMLFGLIGNIYYIFHGGVSPN